jgi:acetyl/propionyl-CoA carboxylase alpha subunit
MRVVANVAEMADALRTARREAGASFGDSDVYLEKFLTAARHIEVQILADRHGSTIHLGDRDCSLQRRHQKVVEEAPAPGLSAKQHQEVRELAVRAAESAGYVSAGTVEFLFDGADNFYLLEINTRIQVEHGVTEAVTGVDIVAEQLRIAAGEPLSIRQEDVTLRGSAIECRLYAENPAANFASSPGRIAAARFPSGPWVREDRGYEIGDEITPYYDGMISKLVVWGPTRDVAIARTRRALSEYRFVGISTNVTFLRWILDTEAFATHGYTTRFIEEQFEPENLVEAPAFMPARAATAAARPALPATRALAPPPVSGEVDDDHAMRAEVFVYHRRSTQPACEYLIHVVPILGGGYQAIPVCPRNHRWAGIEHCRTGWSAEEAVDNLIRGVLNSEEPDEIFQELGMSY